MKRIFTIISIVLIGLFAFVACSPQESFTDELVSVSLTGSRSTTRSLIAENDFDIANVTVWKYTAEKADQGLATGATDTQIALEKDSKGNWMTKALSQGTWNFELFGYNSEGALICSGSVDNQTITVEKHSVKVTVKPSQTGTGKIAVDSTISIVDENGTVYSGDVYTMDYTVTNSGSQDVTATVKAGNAVPSGQYKVKVVFKATSNGEEYVAATASKYINVYDNLTTTVSGTITETEQAAAITAEGGMISATSEPSTVTVANGTNTADVSISVASTPVGTTDTAKQTTVNFPAGALNLSSTAESAKVSLKVEATSIESAATSYSVETSEGAAVASFNFELEGAENAEFNGDNGVEITTYIAKGLDKVTIKYVGTSTGKAPKLVSYSSETGELKFKVFHFSTYLVVSTSVVATDENGTIYESFKAALTSSAKEITLLKDTTLTEAVEFSSNKTVNLNSRTVTISGEIADAFKLNAADSLYAVAFKNGTIAGTTTNNIFTLNSYSSLILDAVTMNVECKRGVQIYQGSNPSYLEVRNGSSITVNNGYYAVATNATNAATTFVSIKINDSTLKTTSDESYQYHDDTTALLCNVPATLEISNSYLIGEKQGVIIRGADTEHSKKITDTTIEATTTKDDFGSVTWKSGNDVPLAALFIGDNSTAYPFGTTVELDNVTLKISESATQHKGLYVYQDSDGPVKVSGSINGDCSINEDTNRAKVYFPEAIIGETYYDTLTDAIKAAVVKTGAQTITLVNDATISEQINIWVLDEENKKYATADDIVASISALTIDMAGHNIKISRSDESQNYGIVIDDSSLGIEFEFKILNSAKTSSTLDASAEETTGNNLGGVKVSGTKVTLMIDKNITIKSSGQGVAVFDKGKAELHCNIESVQEAVYANNAGITLYEDALKISSDKLSTFNNGVIKNSNGETLK